MTTKRATKKQKKQLVQDYYNIVSPTVKTKRIIITKEQVGVEQNFEVFTLYKKNVWTKTSNTTPFIGESNTNTANA